MNLHCCVLEFMSSIAISLDDPSESAGFDTEKEILKEMNYNGVSIFSINQNFTLYSPFGSLTTAFSHSFSCLPVIFQNTFESFESFNVPISKPYI